MEMNIQGLTKSASTGVIRLGIQGAPNSGKTTAALTFPDPIVVDLDHKLPPNVDCLQFWNPAFVDTIIKRSNPTARPNVRDAVKKWLRENIPNIPSTSTLILDSWTALINQFDLYSEYDKAPYLSKRGELDGFAIHKHKLVYSLEILELLKSASCNVVVTFHETIDRNDDGRPTGKLRPLMSGQMSDQLAGHFTAFFRQTVEKGPVWTWTVRSNELFNAVFPPAFVPPASGQIKATYSDLMNHMKL